MAINLETRNGQINETFIGYEHGMLTAMIFIGFGDFRQGFGGFKGPGNMEKFIQGVIRVARVNSWEKLEGTMIRVRTLNGMIVQVGHIIDNIWFTPADELDLKKVQA